MKLYSVTTIVAAYSECADMHFCWFRSEPPLGKG